MGRSEVTKLIFLLWRGSFILQPILCIRLFTTGLWSKYRAFGFLLMAQWIQTALLMSLASDHKLYGAVWIVSQGLILLLEAGVVLSIFDRWTVSFPGIGLFGRSLLSVVLLVAMGLSLATVPLAWSTDGWQVAYHINSIAYRVTNTSFALFLLLMLIFFSKFGGPVASNLRRYSWSMAALVSANAINYYLLTLHDFALGNALLPLVTVAALAFWIFAFTKSGEIQPVGQGDPQQWNAAETVNVQLLKMAASVKLTSRGVGKGK